MPLTFRQFWEPCQGRCTLNYNTPAITRDSVVLISASEYVPAGPDPAHWPRFVGSANISVDNVSPHGPPDDPNHGVTFVVIVDWRSPLYIVTDITVLDQAPVEVDVPQG
jgi:hypothetical protein